MSEKDEILSLNLSDLDIEELEARIELGQLIPPGLETSDDCSIKSGCDCNTCCTNGGPGQPQPGGGG